MKKQIRVRYEMLKRVVEFGTAHHELFPESSTAQQALADVTAAVAAIDAHATEKLLAAQEGQRAKIAARQALRAAMLDIARTARFARRTRRLGEHGFLMPRRESYDSLIRTARTFIEEGEANLDVLVQLGLAPTAFSDLRVLLETLEATLKGRTGGRRGVAESQAGILQALAQGTEAALVLDAVLTNALKDDPATFAGWIRSRRIVDGVSKHPHPADAAPPAPVAGTAPATDASAPAADSPHTDAPDAAPAEPADATPGAGPAETPVPLDPLRRAS